MTVAFGTSTPTSTTVVETSIWVLLSRNEVRASFFSADVIRPCSKPTLNSGKIFVDSRSYCATAALKSSVSIHGLKHEDTELLTANPLTAREREVIELIVEGCSNQEIGAELYISLGTVKTHIRNILDKLACGDRTQAAVRTLRAGKSQLNYFQSNHLLDNTIEAI